MISIVLHDGPGLEDYTFHLANALADVVRLGWSVDANTYARFSSALTPRVTPLVYQRPRRRQVWRMAEIVRQAKAIRAFQPDIIHLQGDGLWESVLVRLVKDIPLVNTVHDPLKHIDQRTLLDTALQKDTIARACGCVVHSQGLRRLFEQRFPSYSGRVLVHPHGQMNYYRRCSPPAVTREQTILFFGELRVNKGGAVLLSAFESARNELSGWKLIIAGRGKGLEVGDAMRERLGDRLEMRRRFIPDEEAADLFSRAGMVVLPYLHGSQSGVLAIAAAFGCPVIVTRSGSFAESLEENRQALFVPPGDAPSLARALTRMAADAELRHRLGENLRRLGETNWRWDTIAAQSILFYRSLLEGENG
jgi:glycosyltransferase involved in cell wall biosynthesis